MGPDEDVSGSEPEPDSQHIEAGRFCDLLTSTRKLERVDTLAGDVHQLRDSEQGLTFCIDQRMLLEYARSRINRGRASPARSM